MKPKFGIFVVALTASLTSTAFAGETQQMFNAADMQQLFGEKSESAQVAILSQQEMQETEGAAVLTKLQKSSSQSQTSISQAQKSLQQYQALMSALSDAMKKINELQQSMIRNMR